MKRLILAIALMSTPLAAWAECMGHEQQVMSCAEDQTWDPQTNTCVPVVSG